MLVGKVKAMLQRIYKGDPETLKLTYTSQEVSSQLDCCFFRSLISRFFIYNIINCLTSVSSYQMIFFLRCTAVLGTCFRKDIITKVN